MIATVNYYNILKEKTKEMDIDFLLDFLETEIDKHLSKGELSFDIQSDLLKKTRFKFKRKHFVCYRHYCVGVFKIRMGN